MFEYIHNNRKLVQFFLALITLPFAFFGIESFVSSSAGGNAVATVGSIKISQQELQAALREQQERLRQQFGRDMPAAMMESPEVRRAVLENLITQRTLTQHAIKSHLAVGDAQLGEAIQSIPAFQDDGKFSRARYDAYVAGQGLSPQEFERRLRQEIMLQQALGAVREGTLTSNTSVDRWIAALQEVREISEAQLKPEQFIGQVKLAADASKKFYDANLKLFEAPEQLRAEYLVLSQEALAAQITVSDKEIADWYQAHADRYKQNEERQASHILINAGKDANEATVKAAQAKAEDILAQLKRAPGDFAKLAKQHSQDPGSAVKGGDLGWFTRGAMVKPFEDAAFALKPNEISGIVRSDFGFHIIKLTAVKAEHARPLAEVRSEIGEELKRQAAAKKYAELAEAFNNTVYEQSDSLNPAAEKFKLTIQQSPWLGKTGAPGQLGNAKLLGALFSDDAIKNKRNTEAVEVAPNTLIAARVLEHKPAAQLPFDGVKANIEQRLVREEATKLALKEGEARLAKLSKGEAAEAAWGAARSVSRADNAGLSADALRAVFKADTAKLPAYAGAASPDGGYVLYRIAQVKPYAGGSDDARAKKLRQDYARIVAEEEFSAWVGSLRHKFPAEINKAALESKEKP